MTSNYKHKLNRTALATSRMMDFFNVKELTTQCGHPLPQWPLVVLKELLDNALDATEESEVAPKITVTMDKDGITVTDNGPGIPAGTLDGILDFCVRVSSREHYASPTRGAQGNALKTVVAMALVLDGKAGRVDISARGIRHEIRIKVDAIRQEPKIDRQEHKDRFVKKGTSIKVYWPVSSRSLLDEAKGRFLQMAADFTFLNPHLSLTLDWCGERRITKATAPAWKKWLPSYPTSPHWYTPELLNRLIAGYIREDEGKGQYRTLREFIAEFSGLSASAKQKAVLDTTGLSRMSMSDLRNGDGLDADKVALLLDAMKASSKTIKPAALGFIGRDHLEERFRVGGCAIETFQYRKLSGEKDGVPTILEAAFAATPAGLDSTANAERRLLITGVNWSPAVSSNPFRELGDGSLDSILQELRAGSDEPVIFLMHLACPLVTYTDRGKSAVVINEIAKDDDD